jgi:hypothetical protein
MHPNYQFHFVREATALPQGSIPSNRPGASACALGDERDHELN